MKNQRGITLIALIVTMIVMLIMVAVAVNVAISEGLIEKAKIATKKTQVSYDQEELQASVFFAFDYKENKIRRDYLTRDLRSGWIVSFNSPYICTSPNKNVFLVDGNGVITYLENGYKPEIKEITDEDLLILEKYIYGDDLLGRNAEEIVENKKFKNNAINFLNGNYDQSIYYCGFGDMLYAYIQYKDYTDVFRVALRVSSNESNKVEYITVPEEGASVIKKIPSDSKIGKTATIEGEKFIVLYEVGEQGENVQLISANTYLPDSISIGSNDNMVDWTDSSVIEEANIFNDTQVGADVLSDIEKSIYSYNHAVKNLNKTLSNLLEENFDNSDILDIRCVGSDPKNKNSEGQMLVAAILQSLPETNSTYEQGVFNGRIKDTDNNYIFDDERMWLLGIRNTQNHYDYWYASRWNMTLTMSDDNNSNYNAYVKFYMVKKPNIRTEIFSISKNTINSENKSYGIRPVITIKADALDKYLD